MGSAHFGPKHLVQIIKDQQGISTSTLQIPIEVDNTLSLKNRIADLEYELSIIPKEIIKYIEVPVENTIIKEIERLVPFETIKEIEKRVEVIIEKPIEIIKHVEVVVEKLITKEVQVVQEMKSIPKWMYVLTGIQMLVIISLLIK